MATRYRRRPTEIEAWQWAGQPRSVWPAWIERAAMLADGTLAVSGIRDAVHRGDWLVREGCAVYRLPPAVFEAAYEKVDDAG